MNQHDVIVDGEAMSAIEGGVDARYLLSAGRHYIVDMQQEPQRRAFNAYRVAFRANQAEPNVPNAAKLVRSWNEMAALLGIQPV